MHRDIPWCPFDCHGVKLINWNDKSKMKSKANENQRNNTDESVVQLSKYWTVSSILKAHLSTYSERMFFAVQLCDTSTLIRFGFHWNGFIWYRQTWTTFYTHSHMALYWTSRCRITYVYSISCPRRLLAGLNNAIVYEFVFCFFCNSSLFFVHCCHYLNTNNAIKMIKEHLFVYNFF